METLIPIKNNYSSLENLQAFLRTSSSFDCTKEYDIWEVRTDSSGQMAQCLILKKSNMHAVKLFFVNDTTVKVNHIIPSKMMNAYFGKNQKARQGILEIIAGQIKKALLSGAQEKAFEEIVSDIKKAS